MAHVLTQSCRAICLPQPLIVTKMPFTEANYYRGA
jgi:hypothetical protein